MEMLYTVFLYIFIYLVKIRPLMDGNKFKRARIKFQKVVVKIRPLMDGNAINDVAVEELTAKLKSDH